MELCFGHIHKAQASIHLYAIYCLRSRHTIFFEFNYVNELFLLILYKSLHFIQFFKPLSIHFHNISSIPQHSFIHYEKVIYFAPFIQQYAQHFFQDWQPLSINFHDILLSEIAKFIHSFKKHFIMFHNIHKMP
jgi:hypothetical protein